MTEKELKDCDRLTRCLGAFTNCYKCSRNYRLTREDRVTYRDWWKVDKRDLWGHIQKTAWQRADEYMDIKGLWDIGYDYLYGVDKKW